MLNYMQNNPFKNIRICLMNKDQLYIVAENTLSDMGFSQDSNKIEKLADIFAEYAIRGSMDSNLVNECLKRSEKTDTTDACNLINELLLNS